jgi:hypothetical protein
MITNETEINLFDYYGSTQRLQSGAGNVYAISQLQRFESIDGVDANQHFLDISIN